MRARGWGGGTLRSRSKIAGRLVVVGSFLGLVLTLLRSQERSRAVALVTLAGSLALDAVTRERESDLLALLGLTLAWAVDVGDEHIRGFLEGRTSTSIQDRRQVASVATLLAAVDVHLSAVHVHLSVTDLVEPRPSQEGLSGWGILGDIELVRLRDRAATHYGVDDLERLALVVGQRDLAGATTVSSATLKRQLVLLARVVVGRGLEGVIGEALTREVMAVGGQGAGVAIVLGTLLVLVQGAPDGKRVAHLHVCRGTQGQTSQEEDSSNDLHYEEKDKTTMYEGTDFLSYASTGDSEGVQRERKRETRGMDEEGREDLIWWKELSLLL